jgi:hypothetical protein
MEFQSLANTPAGATTTHVHFDVNIGYANAIGTSFSITSIDPSYTDVIDTTSYGTGVSWPANTPQGSILVIKSVIVMVAGNIYLAAGSTGTYNLKILDSTQGLSNSYLGLSNTDTLPLVMVVLQKGGSFTTGNHVYKLQADVSDATTTLNIENPTMVIIPNLTLSPAAGS